MIYRKEIDGLRALAVVPVILFHAGFSAFSGGFVGVDVFFVISGYLITTILLNDLSEDDFSIARFYERRARRILPALFLVIGVSIVLGWFWLLPADMEELARSVSYIPVFLTNLFFYRESGYFDTAAELKPLLHTWSLAVEEQYYVFFPLLLLLLWRKVRAFLPHALVFGALVSLLWAEYLLGRDPAEAFFLLPARVWELLVGALVAYWVFCKERLMQSELGSLLGLAMIVSAIVMFDAATRFPGVAALLPVLGTALIVLCATPETHVGRFLGSRVLVGVGLVSYSAYLWHQPLFAFARHVSFETPAAPVFLGLSVLSLLLAYLSWRYVEQPFRRAGVVSRKGVVLFSVLGSLVLIAFAVGGRVSEGYGHRMDDKSGLADVTERMRRNYGLAKSCDDPVNAKNCTTADAPEVLLWGDSYAMHLARGLVESKPDIGLRQFTQSACGPLFDVAPILPGRPISWGEECIRNNALVRDLISRTPSIKYVLLSSRFDQYFNRTSGLLMADGSTVRGDEAVSAALLDTLRVLRDLGVKPVIFSPTPGNGEDLGRCVTRALMLNRPTAVCDFELAMKEPGRLPVEQMLRSVETEVKVVSLSVGMCPQGRCRTHVDDVIVFRDEGHLSYEGSAYLGKKMNFYDLVVN